MRKLRLEEVEQTFQRSHKQSQEVIMKQSQEVITGFLTPGLTVLPPEDFSSTLRIFGTGL